MKAMGGSGGGCSMDSNYFPPVEHHAQDVGVAHHGVTVAQDHVRVLACLQGTHPVGDAKVLGGVDGDGLSRIVAMSFCEPRS